MKKLYSLPQLRKAIYYHKKKGNRVILANGCFDLIHVGHIRYLKESKNLGDILVVALNSDASVHKLKGKGRPILGEKDRAEILGSFSFVDYLTIFEEDNVEKILLVIKPHVHAKGSDYTLETVPEKKTVQSYGGKIIIAGGPKIKSTSELIKEIAAKICISKTYESLQ